MSDNNEEAVILIVDDSSDTLSMLNDALEDAGFSVLVALSGVQAISICKKITPDVILMDAMMPDMSGFDTCKELKKNPKLESIPVIFMTGLDSSEVVSSSFESGAQDYIQKPIRIVELIARINAHVEKARQIKASRELLDSKGLSTIAVHDDGTIAWSTPAALNALENSGIKKIALASSFPLFLEKWLQRASLNDCIEIPNSDPPLNVCFSQEKDGVNLLEVKSAKPKVNETEYLAHVFNLTDRESEVLYWVSLGKSNKELALILGISPRTVNKHLESVFEKMLVENRTSAANLAIKELSKVQN